MAAVEYEVSDGVAWMTMNRPEAHNALSKAVRDGLWEGFTRFVWSSSAHQVRMVIRHRRHSSGMPL